MTDRDEFLARLRADAAPLRYQPDDVSLARLRAGIRARLVAQPSVAELIASWFRPLAAAVAFVALIAAAGLAFIDLPETTAIDSVEIVVGGETYVVGD